MYNTLADGFHTDHLMDIHKRMYIGQSEKLIEIQRKLIQEFLIFLIIHIKEHKIVNIGLGIHGFVELRISFTIKNNIVGGSILNLPVYEKAGRRLQSEEQVITKTVGLLNLKIFAVCTIDTTESNVHMSPYKKY